MLVELVHAWFIAEDRRTLFAAQNLSLATQRILVGVRAGIIEEKRAAKTTLE